MIAVVFANQLINLKKIHYLNLEAGLDVYAFNVK